MAIDSASKRQSALTFGLSFLRGIIPDGVIGQADRQNIAFSYSGILAADLAPALFKTGRKRPSASFGRDGVVSYRRLGGTSYKR